MENNLIQAIDEEIVRLSKARALLAGTAARRGRPARTANATTSKKVAKRKLTPEGRRRIAEAVKRRWAAQKKTAEKAS
jgi:hypothetical protein